MTIDCTNIVKYGRICEKLKDDSQPIYDSGLLDFEHSTMTFGSQKGFGCIKMPVEGWDNERKPFFVNLTSLLNVARAFPILELDGYTFKHGSDTFEIAHSEDDARFPAFDSDNTTNLVLTPECISAIEDCGLFTDVDGTASLNGVFIKDGNIWGTNKNRLCEEHIESLQGVGIALPRLVWETLIMDVLDQELTISSKDTSFFIGCGDQIKLQFAVSTTLQSPDIHNKDFISKFNHDTNIVLDKTSLQAIVKFMLPFVSSSSNQRIAFIIGDNLEIKAQTNGNIISRVIPILERSGTIETGTKVWLSATWLKTILDVLDGDSVRIQVDKDSPAINISTIQNPNTHIVYCRLVEISQG